MIKSILLKNKARNLASVRDLKVVLNVYSLEGDRRGITKVIIHNKAPQLLPHFHACFPLIFQVMNCHQHQYD
jgi:hypothetical protein